MVGITSVASVAIAFVVIGITLGVGAQILDTISGDLSTGRVAQYAVNNTTEGVRELSSWMPTIGLVIAAAIVIGIIFRSFSGQDFY